MESIQAFECLKIQTQSPGLFWDRIHVCKNLLDLVCSGLLEVFLIQMSEQANLWEVQTFRVCHHGV